MRNIKNYIVRYIFWTLSRIFVYVYIRPKFNIADDTNYDPVPKPPFIMISNHATFFDPWIVGHHSNRPIAIMNNEDAFHAPWVIRWYLKNIGTFPKKKGGADYKAMKTTLKRLKLGYPVLIFPEGQTTWDGATQPIYSGIEKIAKKSKVPLVMINVKGNFSSKPWWADTYRKGKVRVTCKVLSKKQIASLSEQEILEAIIHHVTNNDLFDEEMLNTEFTGERLACGLQRFVWICKHCQSEDTLDTKDNTISCSHCKSSWTIDSHFRLTPTEPNTTAIGNLYEWATWHKEQVRKKIATADSKDMLATNNGVLYSDINLNGQFTTIAEGTLALSKESLTFDAAEKEKSFALEVKDITDYVYQRKDVFECRHNNKSYRFRLIHHSPMKWVYYLRYLKGYEEFEKRGYI